MNYSYIPSLCLRVALVSFVFFLSGCLGLGTQSPAPAHRYGLNGGAGSAGVHTVSRGDTLWVIAQRYDLSMQDIIAVNKLRPPFALESGQRLTLPPPQTYYAREGDTLYGVSRTFGVSQTDIVRQNKMQSPYVLRVGQMLRLPSVKPQEVAISGKWESFSGVSSAKVTPVQKEIVYDSNASRFPQPLMKPAPAKEYDLAAMAEKSRAPAASSGQFIWPVSGKVISSYGPKEGGLHNDGINIKAPKNAPVRAASGGTVVYTGHALKGFGNLVLIRHADRWLTAYAHLDRLHVKKGDVVKQGQTVGTVGTTGAVVDPQLHFEIRRGTDALNPQNYLARQGV